MEKWRTIKNYPNYQVSNRGRIRNKKRNKILNATRHIQFGYRMIILSLGTIPTRKRLYVHRLVLQAFKPTSDTSLQVNHLDCNPANNSLENLEWCTQQENVNHSVRLGHYSIHHNVSKLGMKRIIESTARKVIRSDGKIYESISAAAREINTVKQNVWEACHDSSKTARGYSFRFLK